MSQYASRPQEFDPEEYERANQEADRLRAILPEFRAKRSFMRVTDPVTPRIRRHMRPDAGVVGANRDNAVCGLVNRAVNTHAGVRLLTDAGNGDDAMALGRVLMESTVILRWILIDPIYRLDLYCIGDSLSQRRWGTLVEEHFKDSHPHLAEEAEREVDDNVLSVAAFFGDTFYKWARVEGEEGKLHPVTIDKMLKELDEQDGSTVNNFQYDVIYFLHSSWVHSTPNALRSFRSLNGLQYFSSELGLNRAWCATALFGANIFLLLTLQAACKYLYCPDIDAKLDALFETIKANRTRQAASVSE